MGFSEEKIEKISESVKAVLGGEKVWGILN